MSHIKQERDVKAEADNLDLKSDAPPSLKQRLAQINATIDTLATEYAATTAALEAYLAQKDQLVQDVKSTNERLDSARREHQDLLKLRDMLANYELTDEQRARVVRKVGGAVLDFD